MKAGGEGEDRRRDVENSMWMWRGGEGGMNWEIRIGIHTLPRVKQTAMGTCGSSAQCSDDPDGSDEGGGMETQEGGLNIYI